MNQSFFKEQKQETSSKVFGNLTEQTQAFWQMLKNVLENMEKHENITVR